MKTSKMKTAIKILSIAFIAFVVLGSFISISFNNEFKLNDFLKNLTTQLEKLNETIPEDRVYVQLDKPFYKPGETIWLSAFLQDASTMKASKKSEILYVELIDPKGNVSKKINLVAQKGKVNAEFELDENVVGGIYKVKAYTNWQKNTNAFFEKEIQVQNVVLPRLKMKMEFMRKAYGKSDNVVAKLELNSLENQPLSGFEVKYIASINGTKLSENKAKTDETGTSYIKFDLPENLTSNDGLLNVMITYEGKTESISRSIPITLGNIDLSFYPEGGDLVDGLITNVAFKAVNEFGKPADIEAVVKDNEGKIVAEFSSFHNGMGAFNLEPKIGKTYSVQITNPKGIDKTYELPKSMKRGWVMHVDGKDKETVKVTIQSTETETMSLVAQVRGKVYFASEINVARGKNEFEIPTNDFPIGVAQLTLFDSKEIGRAERLVFVNKEKQLNIKVTTDKNQYLPREKVKMNIQVTDERGLPMPANLSMAVVDDKLLSFADDKSSNILSSILLEQDLNTKVEEPHFYFNTKEEKADKALDFLLMTAGWRRFTWEEVLVNKAPSFSFFGELAEVAGKVMNSKGEPIKGATIILTNQKNKSYKSDEKGYFSIRDLNLFEQTSATVSAQGYQPVGLFISSYNSNSVVYLYTNEEMAYTRSSTVKFKARAEGNFPQANVAMMVEEEAAKDQVEFALPMIDKDNLKAQEPPMPPQDGQEKMDVNKNFEVQLVEAKLVDRKNNKKGFLDNETDEEKLEMNDRNKGLGAAGIQQQIVIYHRAKEFAVPVYAANEEVEIRTDFRSTIYWNGNVEVSKNGSADVEFYNSDEVTSFRTTIEGIGVGMVGRTEFTHFTQLPFSMVVKVPSQVVFGDVINVPLTLKNTTNKTVTGNLTITSPKGFKTLSSGVGSHTLAANTTKTIFLNYEVLNEIGEDKLEITFKANGLKDAFVQPIKIGAKGFPVSIAFSGQELKKEYQFSMNNVVDGSVIASLTAYPNVVNDLMKGIESIIREPSGCFEQTSMSNYPNIMAMSYMKETGMDNPELFASIDQKLDRGYKKLTAYETKENGYEWFGSAPGHEALTAYGLMQFNDMKEVYADVSNEMVKRTSKWLMSRRDGNGGFKKNPQALDQFGRASDAVSNGYIVYALSEANYLEITKEVEAAYKNTVASKDAYQLAMLANTLINFNDKRANDIISKLLKLQEKDGSFNADHSITRSGGKSLQVETTSIALMAFLKAQKQEVLAATKAAEFLVSSRDGYGSFGSTQGTVLALKALTEFAKFSKQTKESGTLECVIDGKVVASKKYEAGEKNPITFVALEKHLNEGKHQVEIRYKDTKTALPYTMDVNYNTSLPKSAEECSVDVKATLSTPTCKVGETVRLTTEIKNKHDKGMPMTMAVVGIPSGLSAQPWQLKELQEKGKIGFYEITDNFVVFYFRDLAPNASHTINLDLKAEIPGEFEAPATSGYLYYTNEYKCWSNTGKISIKK